MHLKGTLVTDYLLHLPDFSSKEGTAMVLLMAAKPVVVYRILDGAGRTIGEVVQPSSAPVMGRGGGTVLLLRGDEGRTSVGLVRGHKAQVQV
jgi:hypothetical protein